MNISKIRKLDGGLLLIFKELVDCKNATVVANKLSLSPSAISHSLSRMRTLFDDPLFVRKPHGLEPTARSREILIEVNKIFEFADSLLNTTQAFDPKADTTLFNVAAPEYVTALIAASMINCWAATAPFLSLRYRHLLPDQSLEKLQRGDIDLAIRRFENFLPKSLQSELLYEDEFCVVASRDHPRIQGRITRKQYEQERHVLANAQSEVTAPESKTFPKVQSCVVVGQWLTALSLASETDSLATCHRRLAEQHAERLNLQILDPHFKPYVFSVFAIHRETLHRRWNG